MDLSKIDISKYNTLFLDRDGVINVLLPDDYVKSWAEFQFKPGMLQLIAKWSAHFQRIIVVTNQRGVGRGLMSEEDLLEVHRRMLEEIEANGGRIDQIFYCTANDNSHPNRKPNIGMFHQACQCFREIKKETSLLIGDSDSDIEFANRVGMDSIKI